VTEIYAFALQPEVRLFLNEIRVAHPKITLSFVAILAAFAFVTLSLGKCTKLFC